MRKLILTIPHSISGLLTARFLLYLRAWEYKQSVGADADGGEPLAPLQFAQRSIPQNQGHFGAVASFISSHMEDYGEDPVHRAERARAGLTGVLIRDAPPCSCTDGKCDDTVCGRT